MKYRSKPTECEAMQWDGDPSWHSPTVAVEIVAWVNANGGEALFEIATDNWYTSSPREFNQHPARIAVRTINGWAYAEPGHYVVMGSAVFPLDPAQSDVAPVRDFYPCDPETFERRWEPVAVWHVEHGDGFKAGEVALVDGPDETIEPSEAVVELLTRADEDQP